MRNLDEIYEKGQRKLKENGLRDWAEKGAGTGMTANGNRAIFDGIFLKMRLLHENLEVKINRSILGNDVSMPIFPAPLGGIFKLKAGAERELIEGASSVGAAIFLSDFIKVDIVELVRSSSTPIFWTLPTLSLDELKRFFEKGKKAGVAALGIDVDIAYGSKSGYKHIEYEGISPHPVEYLETIRKMTDMPLFLKGILSSDDARLAVELGYNAIVVSNHGGKVLDYACPTLYMLEEIKKTIGNNVEIFVDGGFLNATDIFKGLALGADGVLLGKSILYGLAASGREGVEDVLLYLSTDLKRIMRMTGCKDLSDVSKDRLVFLHQYWLHK